MYSRRITDAQNSNTVLYVSLFGNLSFKTSRGETLNLSNKRAVAILGLLCIAPEEKMQR